MITLRELRMWHWRKVLSARAVADRHREKAAGWPRPECRWARHMMKQHDRNADFHLSCVVALNDVVSGTAEQDCKDDPGRVPK
jgi:hypothetical protein